MAMKKEDIDLHLRDEMPVNQVDTFEKPQKYNNTIAKAIHALEETIIPASFPQSCITYSFPIPVHSSVFTAQENTSQFQPHNFLTTNNPPEALPHFIPTTSLHISWVSGTRSPLLRAGSLLSDAEARQVQAQHQNMSLEDRFSFKSLMGFDPFLKSKIPNINAFSHSGYSCLLNQGSFSTSIQTLLQDTIQGENHLYIPTAAVQNGQSLMAKVEDPGRASRTHVFEQERHARATSYQRDMELRAISAFSFEFSLTPLTRVEGGGGIDSQTHVRSVFMEDTSTFDANEHLALGKIPQLSWRYSIPFNRVTHLDVLFPNEGVHNDDSDPTMSDAILVIEYKKTTKTNQFEMSPALVDVVDTIHPGFLSDGDDVSEQFSVAVDWLKEINKYMSDAVPSGSNTLHLTINREGAVRMFLRIVYSHPVLTTLFFSTLPSNSRQYPSHTSLASSLRHNVKYTFPPTFVSLRCFHSVYSVSAELIKTTPRFLNVVLDAANIDRIDSPPECSHFSTRQPLPSGHLQFVSPVGSYDPKSESVQVDMLAIRIGTWKVSAETNAASSISLSCRISFRKGLLIYTIKYTLPNTSKFYSQVNIPLNTILAMSIRRLGDPDDEDDQSQLTQITSPPIVAATKDSDSKGSTVLCVTLAVPPYFRFGAQSGNSTKSIAQPDFTVNDQANVCCKHLLYFPSVAEVKTLLRSFEKHNGFYGMILRSNFSRLISSPKETSQDIPAPFSTLQDYLHLPPTHWFYDSIATGSSGSLGLEIPPERNDYVNQAMPSTIFPLLSCSVVLYEFNYTLGFDKVPTSASLSTLLQSLLQPLSFKVKTPLLYFPLSDNPQFYLFTDVEFGTQYCRRTRYWEEKVPPAPIAVRRTRIIERAQVLEDNVDGGATPPTENTSHSMNAQVRDLIKILLSDMESRVDARSIETIKTRVEDKLKTTRIDHSFGDLVLKIQNQRAEEERIEQEATLHAGEEADDWELVLLDPSVFQKSIERAQKELYRGVRSAQPHLEAQSPFQEDGEDMTDFDNDMRRKWKYRKKANVSRTPAETNLVQLAKDILRFDQHAAVQNIIPFVPASILHNKLIRSELDSTNDNSGDPPNLTQMCRTFQKTVFCRCRCVEGDEPRMCGIIPTDQERDGFTLYQPVTCPCLLAGEPCSPACQCTCCSNPNNTLPIDLLSDCTQKNLLAYQCARLSGHASEKLQLSCKNTIIPLPHELEDNAHPTSSSPNSSLHSSGSLVQTSPSPLNSSQKQTAKIGHFGTVGTMYRSILPRQKEIADGLMWIGVDMQALPPGIAYKH
ncbi:hypothetical protein BLNAU_4410 [Blattamonas nauphoetae]|uniref:Uncharacterized protein n=1 Tax=Blattamonas nauphoetae TaxID=2049346 RepID=A0ABQ9Y9R4_9EUKA|nr:hypothetical protein BLNAU_4410 [Blattamonas nauphoetae]